MALSSHVKNPHANAIQEHIHSVFTNMLCSAEIDMANLLKPSDIDVFYQMQQGPFALPTIQYSKPHKVQQYLDETCASTLHSKLTGRKLENIGNNILILTPPEKTKAGLIMIARLVKKYLYGTMVYSTKQNPGI
jgi:hypothetical protein